MTVSVDELRQLAELYDQWQAADALSADLAVLERERLRRAAASHGAHFSNAFDAMLRTAGTAENTDSADTLPAHLDALRDAAVSAANVGLSDRNVGKTDAELPLNPPPERQAGQHVGPYRLIKEIGRGGMGVVWLAARADGQHERQVALKMPLVENLNWLLAARFARERNILASLEHPGIARLYDAGVDSETQPYIALEYVLGVPINEYVRDQRLKPEATVALFTKVINAVSHAHAQLVIHRDIKPSNILVDAQGEPHLLDFGIAKLLDDEDSMSADATQLTRMSGRALTLDYASPEQVNGQTLGTASDVYALGVVLYELLTGNKPYAPKGPTRRDLELAIVEQEPAKPSDRLALTGSSEAGKTARRIRGDLDTVVLKALKKDPKQRYATAQAFADDLKRYLAYEPIAAKPDAGWYRVGRFVRRHRFGVAASGVIAVTVAVGVVSTLWQANIARSESVRANAAFDFLAGIFRASSPYSDDPVKARNTPAIELLQRGEQRAALTLGGDPLALEKVWRTIADVYMQLGLQQKGVDLLAKALDSANRRGASDHEVVAVGAALALAMYDNGSYSEMAKTSAMISLRSKNLSAQAHSELMGTVSLLEARSLESANQRELAEAPLRHSIELFRGAVKQQSDTDVLGYVHALGELAQYLAMRGRIGEATRLLDEAKDYMRARQSRFPTIAADLEGRRGNVFRTSARDKAAATAYHAALEIHQKTLPPDHPSEAYGNEYLAYVYANLGDVANARKHVATALAAYKRSFPSGSEDLPLVRIRLADIDRTLGRPAIACAQTRRILSQVVGKPEEGRILDFAGDLPVVQCSQAGEHEEAGRLLTKAKLWESQHPSQRLSRRLKIAAAQLAADKGQWEAADEHLAPVMATPDTSPEGPSPQWLQALLLHCRIQLGRNSPDLCRDDLASAERSLQQWAYLSDRLPLVAAFNEMQGLHHAAQSRTLQAQEKLQAALNIYVRSQDDESIYVSSVRRALVQLGSAPGGAGLPVDRRRP